MLPVMLHLPSHWGSGNAASLPERLLLLLRVLELQQQRAVEAQPVCRMWLQEGEN
jgi:hypothetical protein